MSTPYDQNVEAVGVIIHRNESWTFLVYLYRNGLVEHSFYKPKELLKTRVAGHTCAGGEPRKHEHV
jgi:hypothetical protein